MPTLGSKEKNILSDEECLSKCVDDYECMAFTYKVRLYNILPKPSSYKQKEPPLREKKILIKRTLIIIEMV